MSSKDVRPGEHRRDHHGIMGHPTHHDPYATRTKAAGAIVCDECGVVHHAGRWYWGAAPVGPIEGGLCPACQRVRDRYPAGTLHLPAEFLDDREELDGILRNAQEREKREHPLERLMDVEDDGDGGLVVTTTGLHLARVLANALERRFHREARVHYADDQYLVRVEFAAD